MCVAFRRRGWRWWLCAQVYRSGDSFKELTRASTGDSGLNSGSQVCLVVPYPPEPFVPKLQQWVLFSWNWTCVEDCLTYSQTSKDGNTFLGWSGNSQVIVPVTKGIGRETGEDGVQYSLLQGKWWEYSSNAVYFSEMDAMCTKQCILRSLNFPAIACSCSVVLLQDNGSDKHTGQRQSPYFQEKSAFKYIF